jgi:hypothetical protein
MNFTESFQEFSSRLTTTDLALYAGVGLVLWVVFKDKLSPVQKVFNDLINKVKGNISLPTTGTNSVVVNNKTTNIDDNFFKLVVSWKQTRDLAIMSGCSEAVKVADEMFPYLSPTTCAQTQEVVK